MASFHKLLISLVPLALLLSSFQQPIVVTIKKPGDSGARKVKLEVVTNNIIHATTTANEAFSTDTSLMVLATKRNPTWKNIQQGDQQGVQTSALRALVNTTTGDVVFTDVAGKIILKETPAGKSFTAKQPDDKSAYTISQSFESPAGEAWYGLGQHQQGVFNYRGTQVSLLQQNTEVAIPFMVSNKNYGILWDNYSISSFGDCRPYEPISTLSLFNAEGKEGGLTATYINNKKTDSLLLKRNEQLVDYEFIQSLKKLPEAFSLPNGKVQWEGSIASAFSGEHSFLLASGGYIKCWIDGKLLLDKWRQCWNPVYSLMHVQMEKGKKYPIKIEWIPDGNESYIALKWLSPLPSTDQNKFAFWSEAGDDINYYFVYGKNMDDVIAGYRELTGRATMLPKWAMGFWQSRERYKTQEEVLGVAKQFRDQQVPIDNIVMDWFYWKPDQWGSHEFDSSRFPNPGKMISDLHNNYKMQFMISVWPKFYTGTHNYDLFNEKGWLYKQNVLNGQKDWVGYVSTFYDAYNPKARDLFWELMNDKLYKKGVDAWWMDATEPDILSNTNIEERKKIIGPTALGSSTRYFNGFAVENAKGVYEGQRATDPNKRVFILTRSAYAGLQRYAAATWSGDIAARWHDFKDQIAAGMNFSLSGLPYWTTDIGGFAVEQRYANAQGEDLEEWREQMTRWYQYGAFCPLFRVHGQFPFREIFNTAPPGHPAYKSMLYYDQLRYRLMPYIYSLAGKTYHNNYTIMRALVMDFANDAKVQNIADQFLFGPSLLVNPVYTYKATSRNLYLPAGTGWYDLYSGKYYTGEQQLNVAAPYERMPLFVKEGSIIPVGPALQYVAEKPADPITLFIYTGKNSQFTLYEDEGTNYNYEKGMFTNIPISYDEAAKTVTIGQRTGSFAGMLTNRTFNIVWMNKQQPRAFDANAKPDATVQYAGNSVTIQMK